MDDGGRPAAAPPAQVTISLQLGYQAGQPPSVDRILGTVAVTPGSSPTRCRFRRRSPPWRPPAASPVRLKLTTSVWIPQQVLGTPTTGTSA